MASHYVGRSSTEGCRHLVFSSPPLVAYTDQLQLCQCGPARYRSRLGVHLSLGGEQSLWLSSVLRLACSSSSADRAHLFPTLHPGTSCWWLETSWGRGSMCRQVTNLCYRIQQTRNPVNALNEEFPEPSPSPSPGS